jgi:hypothetical protein
MHVRLAAMKPASVKSRNRLLAQGVGDAIAAYLVCRSSICPSDHVFHPFVRASLRAAGPSREQAKIVMLARKSE